MSGNLSHFDASKIIRKKKATKRPPKEKLNCRINQNDIYALRDLKETLERLYNKGAINESHLVRCIINFTNNQDPIEVAKYLDDSAL